VNQTLPVGAAPEAVSHNQIGQKLGRKGQQTRERILAAMLQLLAEEDGPPVTLTAVAKQAKVRLPNLYLYFPDIGDLLLAALERVMATADDAYVDKLRERWPDASLRDACLDFIRDYHQFWKRHARLLHMRNAVADAGDLRVFRYRLVQTRPLIDLLLDQMDCGDARLAVRNGHVATVLLTGLERLATVVTNPQFRFMAGAFGEVDQEAHVRGLLEAEADVISLAIGHRRTLAGRNGNRSAAIAH